ncbi:hypothetical protein ABPG75_012653 [Micractinium tetrahymenae]
MMPQAVAPLQAEVLQPAGLYASAAGEAALRQLYNSTAAALPLPHKERLVHTASFGRAHVLICGPPAAPPLMLWHGATTPAPFMLAAPSLAPLVQRFRIHAPDIPCHAGSRSDPAVLDPATHGHGRWCLQVVRALGLLPGSTSSGGDGTDSQGGDSWDACQQQLPAVEPPFHAGVSIGADMLLDLAVVAPGAIRAAALLVPARLQRGGGPAALPTGLLLRCVLCSLLPCAWTERLMLSCIFDEPAAGDPLVEQVKLGIRYLRQYPPRPGVPTDEQLRLLKAPVFLAAAELDVWGPGQASIDRARALWPPAQLETLLLRGARHVPSQQRMRQVIERIAAFFEA